MLCDLLGTVDDKKQPLLKIHSLKCVWLSKILLLSLSWYKLHILSSTVTYLLTHLLMNKHFYCKERCNQTCQKIASSYTLKKGLFLLRQHDPLLMHKILQKLGTFSCLCYSSPTQELTVKGPRVSIKTNQWPVKNLDKTEVILHGKIMLSPELWNQE